MIPLPPGVCGVERAENGNVIGYKWLFVADDGKKYSPVTGCDRWNFPDAKSHVRPTENNAAGFYFTYSPACQELETYVQAGCEKFRIEFVYQHPDDIVFHELGGRAWKVARVYDKPLASGRVEKLLNEHDWLVGALAILVMIVTLALTLPLVLPLFQP